MDKIVKARAMAQYSVGSRPRSLVASKSSKINNLQNQLRCSAFGKAGLYYDYIADFGNIMYLIWKKEVEMAVHYFLRAGANLEDFSPFTVFSKVEHYQIFDNVGMYGSIMPVNTWHIDNDGNVVIGFVFAISSFDIDTLEIIDKGHASTNELVTEHVKFIGNEPIGGFYFELTLRNAPLPGKYTLVNTFGKKTEEGKEPMRECYLKVANWLIESTK